MYAQAILFVESEMEAELRRIQRRVHMFDPLLEEDPWVKEKLEERES
jgi:hypothetical protein